MTSILPFLILIVPTFILAFWAQNKVRSAYGKYVQIPSRGRITGREAALAVMQKAGIHDVEIVQVPGQLTDHYDPMNKRLALSEDNYHGTSLAALGVAAHEAGHAVQHKVGYSMLNARMAMVPVTNIASSVLPIVMIGSLFVFSAAMSGLILKIAVACYLVLTAFHLITLPVEFDASRRAKQELVSLGILGQDELVGVNKTLDAAAWTYVAAFISSLGYLIYLLSMLGGNRE
ncbi:zinc metallopeptidase [Pelagicoccus sp. SDUM812003]|uniref:zinc metallopeptidase n=1 Tax=Pelagicoccus sp. SDUM812003 TaxID=3041267 RepID=UPI00280FCD00|nr:zinc metallopeptidase [Pelagicoccus sp. SDUM812003]MDQ8202466.1 zinc metallopeptidase [Pelagicoccus sp. SDUM812003]